MMNKQEVIEKIKNLNARETFMSEIIWVKRDEVIDIVKQLEEPEKPVVPQFVAEWIEVHKRNAPFLRYLFTNNPSEELQNWLVTDVNQNLMAEAWLYGYEVEKEKLYTAQLKSTGEFLHYDKETDKVHHFCAYGNTARNSKNYHFTEDTLIQYNAWENEAYDVKEVEE